MIWGFLPAEPFVNLGVDSVELERLPAICNALAPSSATVGGDPQTDSHDQDMERSDNLQRRRRLYRPEHDIVSSQPGQDGILSVVEARHRQSRHAPRRAHTSENRANGLRAPLRYVQPAGRGTNVPQRRPATHCETAQLTLQACSRVECGEYVFEYGTRN